jgi:sarcosine/dimethylglycine N-methyltransferase
MSVTAAHDPQIYQKTGQIDQHLEGIKKQYDTAEKREFYAQVMGDGTANIHFGKWDGVDLDKEGAYGRAAENMTDYMFDLATNLLQDTTSISLVDLGSGSGGAAVRLLTNHASITKATCVNLCTSQNESALKDATERQVKDRIQILTSSYDDVPAKDNSFDLVFSQDAFVHSFSKVKTYSEALRIAKPNAVFIFCDLMCGDGPDVSEDELATFAATNMVNDWLPPADNCKACEQAGWKQVTFVDLTSDIRLSFQLMKKKVDQIIARGGDGIAMDLLTEYSKNLEKRVTQVDRGVFKWGVIHAKKE